MKRILILALSGLLATAVASCGKKEAPAGAPPEVYVADVVQKDVPVYMELVGQTKGSQDVEIRARVEGYLNRVAFTEGSFVRKGELLYQIDPKPLEADPRQREGEPGHRPGPAREDQQRREPPDAAGEAAGGQPAGARQRRSPPGTRPAPRWTRRRRRSTRRRSTSATRTSRPRSTASSGTTQVKAGQPRRARREHAAHDGLADRPHPLPGRHQRGRVPAGSPSGSRSRAAAGRGSQGPRSSCSSPTAPFTRRRAASTPSSGRSTRPPAPSPCSSRSRTPSGSCGPGSTAAPASWSRRRRAPSSSRSGR